MEWMLLLVVLLVIAALILKNLSVTGAEESKPLYERQKELLTSAERSFYGVLLRAVDSKTVVFSKVRVADVLKPVSGLDRSKWQTAFNKISAKHFDFVLCDVKTLSVQMVIELDDGSHQKKARVNRDDFLNAACKSAKLDLIRIKAQRDYRIEELRVQLYGTRAIKNSESATKTATGETAVIDSTTKQLPIPRNASSLSAYDLLMSADGFAKLSRELKQAHPRGPQVFVHVGLEGSLKNQVLMIGEAKNGAYNRWMQAANGHKNAFFWSIGESDHYTPKNASEYSNYLLYFAALFNQQTKLYVIDVSLDEMSTKKRELIEEYGPIWDQYRDTIKSSNHYPTMTGQSKDQSVVNAVAKLGAAKRLIFAQRKLSNDSIKKLPDVVSLGLRSSKEWG